jgi:eukaryotic-like serine/threonine-protein kinase
MAIDLTWLNQQFPDLTQLQILGQGGQKYVFSALHPREGDVVLKLIHPHQDPETVRREILAVAQVRSPRVPEILEQGVVNTAMGSFVWIRERRVIGEQLRALLRFGPFPISEVLRMSVQLLEALERAEAAKIVHRDVKPDNIMRDQDGNYWLLDFGIARHLDLTSMTATASPFGKCTMGYAAPEQCRNIKRDIDSRADLFAAGVTIFEVATGRNPFLDSTSGNFLDQLHRIETVPLPPLLLDVASRNSFRDLVEALTQKRRDLRPRSVTEALVWMREIEQAQ